IGSIQPLQPARIAIDLCPVWHRSFNLLVKITLHLLCEVIAQFGILSPQLPQLRFYRILRGTLRNVEQLVTEIVNILPCQVAHSSLLTYRTAPAAQAVPRRRSLRFWI